MPKGEKHYETPRRSHCIMTREEAEAGKPTRWEAMEIRGPIRNLSSYLWSLTHLTALFLNDNSLQRIPPDITRLCNLQCLDLSGNKLRSLPAELGDMTHLRELLLNHNMLRVLPYELGKLFLLQNLGLAGNPLQPEILAMVNEPNGTSKLLSFLLDNLSVAPRPPDREWISLPLPDQPRANSRATFNVMSYNILTDKLATRQLYGYCPSWALTWEYRKQAILKEILDSQADIIALQEVEMDQFYNFFIRELQQQGYDGIFTPKSRAKTMGEHERKFVDGCALFFHKQKFALVEHTVIEFNKLAMANAEGSDDMVNRVQLRDNVGQAALLEVKETIRGGGGSASQLQHILVANVHIHWDPEFSDVKLIQTVMLMSELDNFAQGVKIDRGLPYCNSIHGAPGIPFLLCGDFNSLPDSGVLQFLLDSKIPTHHPDFKDLAYDGFMSRFSQAVSPGSGHDSSQLIHRFAIKRAYQNEHLPFTNYTYDFKGILDYIYYSYETLQPLALLGPVSKEWFEEYRVIGCPNPHYPSDHVPLLCEFEMRSQPLKL